MMAGRIMGGLVQTAVFDRAYDQGSSAAQRKGTQKRFDWAPKVHAPEPKDWEAHLGKTGPEGGMSAQTTTIGASEKQFCDDLDAPNDTPVPNRVEIEQQAARGFRCMERALARTGQRKVCPAWGVAAKSIYMATAPGIARDTFARKFNEADQPKS